MVLIWTFNCDDFSIGPKLGTFFSRPLICNQFYYEQKINKFELVYILYANFSFMCSFFLSDVFKQKQILALIFRCFTTPCFCLVFGVIYDQFCIVFDTIICSNVLLVIFLDKLLFLLLILLNTFIYIF